MTTYAQPRKDDASRWLCTVTAKCNSLAVAQSAYDCSGCETAAAEHSEQIDKLTAERDQSAASVELIRSELARRADAGEDGRLSAVEEVAVRLGMDRVRQLGAAVEQLTAAHAAVVDSHTHPVFACAKHKDQLPD